MNLIKKHWAKLTTLQRTIINHLNAETWTIIDAEHNHSSTVELVRLGLVERNIDDLRKFRRASKNQKEIHHG